MVKKLFLTISIVLFANTALLGTTVKADTATANNMIPTLRLMYQVDAAEAILKENKANLKICRKNKASAIEIATAQAAVTDATNLVNTLNVLISRDVTLIKTAPAGVVNPPTFAVNSLTARGAWNDYYTKAKAGHAMIFPSSQKKGDPVTIAPFCMY